MILGKYSYTDGGVVMEWGHGGAKFIGGKFCSIGKNLTVYVGGESPNRLGNNISFWSYKYGCI